MPPLDPDLVQITWAARYDGRCARCDQSIREGERMGRTLDGDYVCWRCMA